MLRSTVDTGVQLYALHSPEVVCIAKGKARTPYEFGAKVGIATTNREGFALAAKSFEGNPYDVQTLSDTVAQAVQMTGVEPERIYVNRGYRGHDYDGEATIGHMKPMGGLTETP